MITQFNPSIFQELAPHVPADLLQDAHYIGLDSRAMASSLRSLSEELQHALRQRGQFANADAVFSCLSPKITGLAHLIASVPEVSKLKREADSIEFLTKQRRTDLAPFVYRATEDGPMELTDSSSCTSESGSSSDAALSSTPFPEVQDLISPAASCTDAPPEDPQQPGNSQASPPVEVYIAEGRVAGLKRHVLASRMLDFFKINLSASSPQETIQKIEMKIRQLLIDNPGTFLTCLPGNLSANPDLVANFLGSIYHKGMLDVLERLFQAGSRTASTIAGDMISCAQERGVAHAVLFGFKLTRLRIQAIFQEITAQGPCDLNKLFQGLRMYPHVFIALFF